MITGGTGSFGRAFVKATLEQTAAKRIVIFSRDELKQWEMQQQFENNTRLRFFLGDVRDLQRLYRAMDGIEYVVHAAALKQVPAAEYNPFEAVQTNILGSRNVIDAAIEPNLEWWAGRSRGGTPVAADFQYTSDTNDQRLNVEQLQDIVRNV